MLTGSTSQEPGSTRHIESGPPHASSGNTAGDIAVVRRDSDFKPEVSLQTGVTSLDNGRQAHLMGNTTFGHFATAPNITSTNTNTAIASTETTTTNISTSMDNTELDTENRAHSLGTNNNSNANNANTNAMGGTSAVGTSNTDNVNSNAVSNTNTNVNSSTNNTNNTSQKGRKRVLRACDQCYHLRTKCDGTKPCSHCQDLNLDCAYLRVPQKRGKASKMYLIGAKKKAELQEKQKQEQQQRENLDSVGGGAPAPSSSSSSDPSSLVQRPHMTVLSMPSGGGSEGFRPIGAMETYNVDIRQQQHQHQPPPQMGARNSIISPESGSGAPINPDYGHGNSPQIFTSFDQANVLYDKENNGGFSGFPHLLDDMSMDTAMFQGQPNILDRSVEAVRETQPGPGQGHVASHPFTHPGMHVIQMNVPVHESSPSSQRPPPPATSSHTRNHLHSQTRSHHMTGTSMSSPSNRPQSALAMSSHTRHNSTTNTHSPQIHGLQDSSAPTFGTGTIESPSARFADFTRPELGFSRYPILQPVAYLLQQADIGPMTLIEELLSEYFDQSTHVLAYLIRRKSILNLSNPRPTSLPLIFAMLLVAAHHSSHPLIVSKPSGREAIVAKLTRLTIAHLQPLSDIMCQGSLDDVITLIQLATIVSASEYKGTSLRYWAMAWDLAKEIKLNYEVPELDPESREERRRTWWLLYMVDRHLGLCYNRPLTILDSECAYLCHPLDERIWESNSDIVENNSYGSSSRGVPLTVNGQGIFGYFLPLMAILGVLVDWHHLSQNPIMSNALFGTSPGGSESQEDAFVSRQNEIKEATLSLLDNYERSVATWSRVPVSTGYQSAWSDYAMQLVSVLRNLATVSWDPVELMSSTNTAQFSKAVGCGIEGVKRIRRILQVDPDLRLMPFFFGIYLFQGSLVLLAAVDRAKYNVSQEVVESCEILVRAHEVCIVTLNTEYQRNFRRVMRATMNMLASQFSDEEEQRKQHAVLGLYRWIRGGRGLAVQ